VLFSFAPCNAAASPPWFAPESPLPADWAAGALGGGGGGGGGGGAPPPLGGGGGPGGAKQINDYNINNNKEINHFSCKLRLFYGSAKFSLKKKKLFIDN